MVKRTTLITRKNYTYHSQELHLSLARTTLITRKNYPFIHFHPKMRNPTASLFRLFQPPILHARACE
ncbi:hypothetical protein EC558_07915 [Helicobacter pylori]|nr:hypothetical protein EC558_07915 [Helicobacter pylori]